MNTLTQPSHLKHANIPFRWMSDAIKLHLKFQSHFQAAKESALMAGIFFSKAQQACAHGEWQSLIQEFSSEVSETTVRRYMDFSAEVVEWVKKSHPNLKSEEDILAEGKRLVLLSPKGYVALCRQLALMRKFGEYDEVRYRKEKLLSQGQIEFDFSATVKHLETLAHFGDEKYLFIYPEGVEESAFLEEVETKLATALERVRAAKAKI